jgi:hypothetical protein
MEKTRNEIKREMTASFVNNTHIRDVYGLTEGKNFEEEFSLVSFENILFDVISFAIFLLHQLFNIHNSEIDIKISNQKTGRKSWYRWMALQFQYGFDLKADSDGFDNTGATPEQIQQSKIIKYAAVNDTNGRVIIKIAGETAGLLAPLTNLQKESVEAYFEEVKYAGTSVTVINYLPDRLYLVLRIYRDPLVIDANGVSVKNGGKPVEIAIQNFMKELPFNGEYSNAALIDKLQQVEGVKIPHLIVAQSSWVDPSTAGYGTPTNIDVKRVPESGYFEIQNFDNITYVI